MLTTTDARFSSSPFGRRNSLHRVNWFGEQFDLEVIASEGDYPLLGVGLLADHDLHISYRSGEVRIL